MKNKKLKNKKQNKQFLKMPCNIKKLILYILLTMSVVLNLSSIVVNIKFNKRQDIISSDANQLSENEEFEDNIGKELNVLRIVWIFFVIVFDCNIYFCDNNVVLVFM